MPRASIIIANHNGRRHIGSCLDSIARQSFKSFEVLLVDNASTDGSVEFVRSSFPWVTVVESRQNLGFARGCNVGVEVSRGDYLVFLNSDTKVDESWLEELVVAVESDPSHGISCSKVLYDQDTRKIDAAYALMDIYGTVINVGHEEEDRGQYDKRKSVFSAYGASFLVKRSLFNRLGGFDERFFLQFEETDFCWRANLLGFNVIYAPTSLAYHVGRASIRAKYLAQWRVRSYGLYTRNRIRSILKNMEGRNLLRRFLPMSFIYLAASLGYSLIERNPMYAAAYAGAIVWNVRLLADTLRERAKIKGMRVVSDADLERKMYTRSIFLWRSYFPSSLF